MATYDPRLRMANKDQEPIWLIDLEWYTPSAGFEFTQTFLTNDTDYLTNDCFLTTANPQLSNDTMYTNNSGMLTNSLTSITAIAVNASWGIKQYKLHRGSTVDFTPGVGTLLDTVATPGTDDTKVEYQDLSNPEHDTDIYYKLETIIKNLLGGIGTMKIGSTFKVR